MFFSLTYRYKESKHVYFKVGHSIVRAVHKYRKSKCQSQHFTYTDLSELCVSAHVESHHQAKRY